MTKSSILKLLAAVVAAAVMLAALASVALAAQSGDFTYELNGNEVTITGYTGNGGDVTIPATIAGKKVSEIGNGAFYYRYEIKSITIPSSVKKIGGEAFYHCTGLTSLTIPYGVVEIGPDAFEDCTFSSLSLSSSVKSIWGSAFNGCTGLTTVTIPGSVTTIGICAFYGCTSLTGISIPAGVTTIGDMAFCDCTSMTGITVAPANPSYMSKNGVLYSKDQKTLICYPAGIKGAFTIPGVVTTVADSAFADNDGLTGVTIPGSVTSIGMSVFWECNGLTQMTIPGFVSVVSGHMFYHCDKLQSVIMQSGITEIGDFVFADCESLSNVTIPASVKEIQDNAFFDCQSLTGVTLPSGITEIADGAFGSSGLTSVSIPAGVTRIGSMAFMQCRLLASVSIPNSVKTIEYCAFADSGLKSVSLPDSVTTFGEEVFRGCGQLASAKLPSVITSIAPRMFSSTGLTSIKIPNSVTSIGSYAFQDCLELTSVTIPANVKSIGISAFSGCWNLSAAYCLCNAPTMDYFVFDGCKSNFTVYYLYGRTGYTNPWHGYPAHVYTPAGKAVVLFNSQGGSAVAYQLVNLNAAIHAPSAPTRAGYAFLGWYREAACTTPWNFSSDKVTGNITLFAKWAALPAVPTGVAAVSASYNSIKLTWNAVSGAAGYDILRMVSGASSYSPVSTVTSASFTDTNLLCGTRYIYKVRAYKWSGSTKVCGSLSAYVYATPALTAPASLKALPATYNSINVSWSAVAGATKYELYRSVSKTGTYSLLIETTTLSYMSTNVNTGTVYYYRVKGYRLVGSAKVYGGYSPIASAQTTLGVPMAVRASRASATSVTVNWDAVAGATMYEVWHCATYSGTYTLLTTTTSLSLTNTGLTTGRTYYYNVRAYRLVGSAKVYSSFSAVVYAKP